MATDQLSRTFAALADPTRRDLVARLTLGDATLGELAGFGQSGTTTDTGIDHLLLNKWRTMATDLNHIFSCIRARSPVK